MPTRNPLTSHYKHFTVLENNPAVMNALAYSLGLSRNLAFHDILSLTDPDLLAFIPRPVHALLVIIPMTPTWAAVVAAEDADKPDVYTGKGAEEPVIWFKQTIGDACGSIGLIHALLNSPVAAAHIAPGSALDQIRKSALDKGMWERAKVLEECEAYEKAHAEAAVLGDTKAPQKEDDEHLGQHFVAFVKGRDGHLWELEGGRKGPIDGGLLEREEDVLSAGALERGLGGLMRREMEGGGDLRFSAIALTENVEYGTGGDH